MDVRAPCRAQKPERAVVELPPLEPRLWGEDSQRSGLLAVKVGMTQEWDAHGVRVPLTVLWVDSCHVLQVKTDENEGYNALQLGVGSKRRKQLRVSQVRCALTPPTDATGPLRQTRKRYAKTPDVERKRKLP
jgi:ribosomal protein L3